MENLSFKNHHDYYHLKKLAMDLKQDLRAMKTSGIDPRSFLGGTFNDYVSRVDALMAVEKRRFKH